MFPQLLHYLRTPNWRRQGNWRRMVWETAARLGLNGVHGLPVNRRWVDIHRRKMPFEHLDPAFVGMKIVQLSDLHYSPVVWAGYLRQFVDWVNALKPDLVVITGDLVTGGYRWSLRVARILEGLNAPDGVICTLGNHDYSIYGKSLPDEGRRRADFLERALKKHGLIVLRNEVLEITRPGAGRPLTIVGLDDEWSGAIDLEKGFAGVSDDHPVLCLNHNPANARELLPYPWQWMLSGHTHGRQLATSAIGRRFNAHRRRAYTRGYYAIDGRHLYVNRGLSYGQRTQSWCRPEITVFKLTNADDALDAAEAAQEDELDHPPLPQPPPPPSRQRHSPQ